MQADLQKKAIPTTFVALGEAGELMGSASLLEHDMQIHQELTPWLASVFVHPDHRRRGVATSLVERGIEEARALGVETLYLYTEDQERLYGRLGWREMERRDYMGYPVVIMELAL
jgi:N-acetylglutamate synthase-like GNAT family acetyltransferase